MHLEAEATLTKERLRKFGNWTYYRKDYTMKFVLLLLCMLVAISWSTYLISGNTNLVTLLMLVIELLVLVVLFVYPIWSASSQFGSRPANRLNERFTFSDEGFEMVNDTDPNAVLRASVRFEGLHLVVEQPELFYFFLERNQAYIVGKTDFTEGDPDELGRYLQELLGAKYVFDR